MSNGGGSGEEVGNADDEPIPQMSLTDWNDGAGRALDSSLAFKNNFQFEPEFFVRVPGRVNLIGEHIDYCGYGVFPMAIEQDVFISARVARRYSGTAAKIQIINVLKEYSAFECPIEDIGDILSNRRTGVKPEWYLYILCGVQGILEHFSLRKTSVSFQLCVDCRVPSSAGLSSSSALVCAAALATLVANNVSLTKKEVASLCAKSERYIGTQGGGMDQAIAFLATAGSALQIEFVPSLRGEKVRLPSNAIFVIVNSLAVFNKAASASFNLRVAECRLATWILAKRSGQLDDCFQYDRLKDLQVALGLTTEQMEGRIRREFHEKPYKIDEIAGILRVSTCELLAKPLMKVIETQKESTGLKLFQRINHVIQETQRVNKFRKVCEQGIESVACLEKLGRLMSQSHWSLSTAYECSHPFLDQMVKLSEGKAYGARLTGAGWGGCMVALVDMDKLSAFMETMLIKYYHPVHKFTSLSPKHCFLTEPGAGATILTCVPTLNEG